MTRWPAPVVRARRPGIASDMPPPSCQGAVPSLQQPPWPHAPPHFYPPVPQGHPAIHLFDARVASHGADASWRKKAAPGFPWYAVVTAQIRRALGCAASIMSSVYSCTAASSMRTMLAVLPLNARAAAFWLTHMISEPVCSARATAAGAIERGSAAWNHAGVR